MNWLWLVAYFFGGGFAVNAIPHFVAGTMGRPFQSPFAKPPGQGLSSATVNPTFALGRIFHRKAVCFQWAICQGLHYILS